MCQLSSQFLINHNQQFKFLTFKQGSVVNVKLDFTLNGQEQFKQMPLTLIVFHQFGATQDKSTCLPCGPNSTYSVEFKDCVCGDDEKIVEANEDGTFLDQKTCAPCAVGSYPGPVGNPIYKCEPCPLEGQVYDGEGQCQCSTAYTPLIDQCVPVSYRAEVLGSATTPAPVKMEYSFAETKQFEETGNLNQVSVTISDTMSYFFDDAAIGCDKFKNPKKCQVLANLCVLVLYNEGAEQCIFFKRLVTEQTILTNSFYNDNGWKVGLPWLYYQRSFGDVMYQSKRVKFRVSFGYENQDIGIINKLTYKLAKFDLEGNFYGFETLTNQLMICESSLEEIERLKNFGTTIQNTCTYDVSKLVSQNQYDRPRNANMFYELYIEDYNGDLIDVPVVVRNLLDQVGDQPNSEDSNESNYRLTKRFFIFDTVSGIESSNGANRYIDGGVATVVRYPESITLRIKLDPDNQEMIYQPLLIINYRERSRTAINGDDYNLASPSFTVEYAMDTSDFWRVARNLFIAMFVLFGVILVIKLIVWCQTPSLSDDPSAQCKFAIVKIFIVAIDLFSNLFFWFLVIFTGYWFIFFKLQERVYVLLPALNTYSENYKHYDFLFFFVFGAKLLAILYKIIFEQCSFDIFLIDWERPKLQYMNNGEERRGTNAWRSLFLVNELNEIQIHKLISIEFTLLLYAFFMEGLGWKYLATHDPQFTNKPFNSPMNYPLHFFVTAVIVYIIGTIQYLLRYLIKFRIPLKSEEITDLCSICNISLLIFDETFHGYYVHGRSPYGQAEVSSGDLRKALEYEQAGKAQERGLTSEDPNLQTFEIYMPKRMLQDYRDHYLKDVREEILKQNNDNTKRFNAVEVILTKQNALPNKLDLELLEDQRTFMNMIMQTYVEQVKAEPRKYVQERGLLSRLLNLPSQITQKGIPIMFKDGWYSFSSVFLQGLDFDFLMMDVLTISFIDSVARNNTVLHSKIILGILIAYLLDQFLIFLRETMGRKNLARHTLADERFLI